MKKLLILVSVIALTFTAFAGIVSGTLNYPEGTGEESFYVIITANFTSLDSASIGFTTPPGYDYTVEGDFVDSEEYHAFAVLPSSDIPVSGDPAGIYEENPFHTSGGNASGIDINIETDIEINGTVEYDDGYENVYVNTYDFYLTYAMGDTVIELENIPVNAAGEFTIAECPTGPKAFMAYEDVNGNMTFDEGEEPNVWYDNDLMGIVVVAGGTAEEPNLNLNLYDVKEKAVTKPSKVLLKASPNPFNSQVKIDYTLQSETEVKVEIYDLDGTKVINLENASKAAGQYSASWNGKNFSGKTMDSGVYLVKMTNDMNSISKKVIFIK